MKNNPIQEKVLDFLREHKGNLGELSLRDIGEALGLGRKAQVIAHHLQQLEKRGLLRRDPNNPKKYILVNYVVPEVVKIPLYGMAQCGPDGFLGDDAVLDRIVLPTRTFGIVNPEDFFLIKTRGKSMEPLIKEGDLVLARKQEDVENGEIAVVVHNGMPKVKKVIKQDSSNGMKVYLVSNNKEFEDEIISSDEVDLQIVGQVKAVIKTSSILEGN